MRSNLARKQLGLTSLEIVYLVIGIIVVLLPVIYFFYYKTGLQDIYWDNEPLVLDDKPLCEFAGYQILNKSVLNSKPLKFAFAVDIPQNKIDIIKNLKNPDQHLKDSNNLTLLVDIGNYKDANYTTTYKNGYTTIEIESEKGLGWWEDTVIKLFWRKGSNFKIIEPKLSSNASFSMNYKIYPHESNRQLFAKIGCQFALFVIAIVTVLIIVVLVKMLLHTKRDLKLANKNTDDTRKLFDDMTRQYEQLKGMRLLEFLAQLTPEARRALSGSCEDVPKRKQINSSIEERNKSEDKKSPKIKGIKGNKSQQPDRNPKDQ